MRCRLPNGFRSPPRTVAVALALACLLPASVAQEKQPEKSDEKTEFAEFLDDARHYAIRAAKPEAALKLHESAVLNFTNPERNQERGSVFVWLTDDGRPAVVGQFFRFDNRAGRLKKHALHSLLGSPIEAKFNDRLAWAPEEAGVEWKSFPDAPPPGATKKERLIQMKRLAQPMTVNLIDPSPKGKPIELRRLDRPLFEYTAPKAGVSDGAIFSYVVATDPEAILLVEAFDENGKTGFRYAFARFHYWPLTAKHGDKTVWDVGYEPVMIGNRFANPESLKKVYNSYHP